MFAPGAIVGLQAIRLGVRVDAHIGTTAWTRVVNPYGDDARRTACFRAEPGHRPGGRPSPGGRHHWGKRGCTIHPQLEPSYARCVDREFRRYVDWLP